MLRVLDPDVLPDVLPLPDVPLLDRRFLFLPPDLLPLFIVPEPEVLPPDCVPTLLPDPAEPVPTVEPLFWPERVDVPLCPVLLPDDVPDWVLEPVLPCDEELPELVDCARVPTATAISSAAVNTVVFIRLIWFNDQCCITPIELTDYWAKGALSDASE